MCRQYPNRAYCNDRALRHNMYGDAQNTVVASLTEVLEREFPGRAQAVLFEFNTMVGIRHRALPTQCGLFFGLRHISLSSVRDYLERLGP